MARLIIPATEDWYEEMAIVSCYYETEYEAKFKQHVREVFPDYFVITIKDTINSIGRKSRKPDLVLIKNDLSEWWLVEVELEAHRLSHVLNQVRVFANPDFNHITFGKKLKDRIDEEIQGHAYTQQDLQDLVLKASLNVLVVVDEYIDKWKKSLQMEGVKLCIFQVFKNTRAGEAYRIDGEYPRTLRKVTFCSSYRRDPHAYELHEAESMGLAAGDIIEVFYNDRAARFDLIQSEGRTIMRFNGKYNHVPTRKDYVLYIENETRLILKQN